MKNTFSLDLDCYLTKFIIGSLQILSDCLSKTAFYMVSLQHMYQLSVFEESNAWGRRREREHIVSHLGSGIGIEARKNRYQMVRLFTTLKAKEYARAGISCRTTTYGINHNKGSARALNSLIYSLYSMEGFKTCSFKLRYHRSYYFRWIHNF